MQQARIRIANWNYLYSQLQLSVDGIAEVTEKIAGSRKKDAWIQRFRSEFCPDLYSERLPDQIVAWINKTNSPVDAAENVEVIYSDYQSKLQTLLNAAFVAGVLANKQNDGVEGTNAAQLAYARRLLAIRQHVNDTVVILENAMPEESRRELKQIVQELRLSSSQLAGPTIAPFIMDRITHKEDR